MEAGAGQAASFTDAAYEEAGATVVKGGDAWKADIVVKVRQREGGRGGEGGEGGGRGKWEAGRKRGGGEEGRKGGGERGRERPPFCPVFGASDGEGGEH